MVLAAALAKWPKGLSYFTSDNELFNLNDDSFVDAEDGDLGYVACFGQYKKENY